MHTYYTDSVVIVRFFCLLRTIHDPCGPDLFWYHLHFYTPVYCFTGVANKEISRGKLLILSGKVGGNEFCEVVLTL